MGLHTVNGLRKYLTAGERETLLREADRADRMVKTLCMRLTYAGCQLSEALALTVDLAAGVLTFESLKKRRDGIYRSVPVPPALLEALDMVHGIREQQAGKGRGRGVQLWPWSRMTGWRAVHDVMVAARLEGPHASPKGLRHGFGVAAVSAGIPLTWCRNGSDTPSFQRLRFMLMRSVLKRRTSLAVCGADRLTIAEQTQAEVTKILIKANSPVLHIASVIVLRSLQVVY